MGIDYIFYVISHYDTLIDEIRLSKGALYTDDYVPSGEPFTTNNVLVIPDNAKKGDILIHSNYDVSDFRIGGAKPTYPSNNYVFVALDDDDVVTSVQQYQVNKWVDVSGRVYLGNDTTENLVGYDMAEFKVSDPDDSNNSNNSDSENNDDEDDSASGSGLDSLLDGIRDIFDAIANIFGTILSSLSDFLTSALDLLTLFTNFANGFAGFLSQVFIFIPDEIWKVIGSGLSLIIIASIIMILKG